MRVVKSEICKAVAGLMERTAELSNDAVVKDNDMVLNDILFEIEKAKLRVDSLVKKNYKIFVSK